MWNKLTSVLKTRSDADVPSPNVLSHPSRGTKSLDLQRTLPALPPHDFDSPKPLPAPSPPSSPSKYGRLGLFRRSSKTTGPGNLDNSSSVSLAKKVKASLNINTNFNVSNVSITPSNYTDGARMFSPTDAKLPPVPTGSMRSTIQPRSAPLQLDLSTVNDATSYFSQADELPKSAPLLDSPMTPFDFAKNGQGSVRSILKDKRTPGTGQSVRFFSRDAYRVLSPESSNASASMSLSGGNNLERIMDEKMDSLDPLPAPTFSQSRRDDSAQGNEDGPTNYLSAPDSLNDLFSPLNAPSPASSRDGLFLDVQARHMNADRRMSGISQAGSTASLFVPIPPPELSDPFDLSAAQEYDVQPIPYSIPSAEAHGTDDGEKFDQGADQSHVPVRKRSSGEEAQVLHSTPNGIGPASRSLGRRAGGAFFKSLTGNESSLEKGRSSPVPELPNIPPRSASSLGLYKLFNKDADKENSRSSMDEEVSISKSRRERAQSERVFFRSATPLLQEELKKSKRERPEADINDTSKADIVLSPSGPDSETTKDVSAPAESFGADPFGANAKGYYTAEVGIPNSPPKLLQQHNRTESGDSKSSRTSNKSSKSAKSSSSKTSHKSNKSQTSISALGISSENNSNSSSMSSYSESSDLVLSLRTQLAFHQELTGQFEKDISSRDELVSLLNSRISNFEEEAKERSRTLRAWRKKFTEMEKACRVLEEEVDRSKQEIAERSVYDEASGDALRALHTQIKLLQREKRDVEQREKELKDENEKLKKDKKESAAMEQQLKASIEEAVGRMKEMEMGDMSMEGKVEDMRQIVAQGEQEFAKEAERYRLAEFAWEEEKEELVAKIRELESVSNLQDVIDAREAEIGTLNEEIQTQGSRSDRLKTKIDELLAERVDMERECEHLRAELANLDGKESRIKELEEKVLGVQEMEERMMHMEVEWTESENRRNELESEIAELYAARDDELKEKEQILDELNAEREHVNDAQRSIQSLETRTSTLEQERDFAAADVKRLEGLLRERTDEITELKGKLGAKDALLDSLQDDLSALRREHSRVASDKSRTSSEVNEARSRMEEALRARAQFEAEAQLASTRVKELESEVEKMRRQVHVLKQDSADMDMKVTQLQKQLEQANDDKYGLNLALELKQEELQAVKRKISTSKIEGTPVPSSAQRSGAARRESALFTTPLPSRPPSALSDTGSKATKAITTPSTASKPAVLGRSTRINNGSIDATPTASKAMPPPSRAPLSSSTSSVLGRSVSAKPSTSSTKAPGVASSSTQGHHRRVSSTALSLASRTALMRSMSASSNMSDSSSIAEDKENLSLPASRVPTPLKTSNTSSTPGPKSVRRKSLIPASPAQ
ncbi:hypothetical protein SCHPADRAFT_994079 [Schizopora paradoxa]|uniref:Uncharacterized protein n=1 Tax=Schizopora paradoxa TaxID=27342 RepID=A0A0H2S1L0_9AGAM|nr:hypothetical protein SCHPADRAFT_994079 [Schizopora paradoxa]